MTQFFPRPQALTVREIAALTGAAPRAGPNLDHSVSGIAALDRARATDLAFIDSTKYAERLAGTRAGVCLTTDRLAEHAPASLIVLRTAQPLRDFVAVARKLYPYSLRPTSL